MNYYDYSLSRSKPVTNEENHFRQGTLVCWARKDGTTEVVRNGTVEKIVPTEPNPAMRPPCPSQLWRPSLRQPTYSVDAKGRTIANCKEIV